jgi:hypothetical protein
MVFSGENIKDLRDKNGMSKKTKAKSITTTTSSSGGTLMDLASCSPNGHWLFGVQLFSSPYKCMCHIWACVHKLGYVRLTSYTE